MHNSKYINKSLLSIPPEMISFKYDKSVNLDEKQIIYLKELRSENESITSKEKQIMVEAIKEKIFRENVSLDKKIIEEVFSFSNKRLISLVDNKVFCNDIKVAFDEKEFLTRMLQFETEFLADFIARTEYFCSEIVLSDFEEILTSQTVSVSHKNEEIRLFTIEKFTYLQKIIDQYLQNIAPKTWSKTSEAFLDTIEMIPDEIKRWEERNFKYVAYLVIAWDLLGYCRYFLKTLISNAIATKRVSS